MQNNKTTRLVVVGLLLAMEIILTRFCSISTPILRMGFGFLPITVIAIMYGPIWAGVTYALGDLIGAWLFPIGPYFPGFTLTAFLSGLIFGVILYKKEITWKRALLASFLVVVFMDLILNTVWLSVLWGDAFIAILPTRIVKCIFAIPIETILITVVWNKVCKRIPQIAF